MLLLTRINAIGIMTRSLIRLGNTVRASLNNDCMTNSHDDRRGRARTETDRDSHDEYD